MQRGEIVQVNISPGGVPKLPVMFAEVGELGLAGDGHADRVHHGGPDRAVCLFAIERIEAMAAEGHPIAAGSAGENITTRGIDWDQVVPATRLALGPDVVIEITGYTAPCSTIKRSFTGGDFNRMNQKVFPGWSRTYARVVSAGIVRAGDSVELLDASALVGLPRPAANA